MKPVLNNDLQKANIKDIYKLSPIQEGIYYHAIAEPQSQAYFSQLSYRLLMDVEPSLVEQCVQQLMDRHDILRTVFNHNKSDNLLQVVLKKRLPAFYYADLGFVDNVEAYIESFRVEDRKKSFDLSRDVLVRLALLKVGEKEYEFIWSYHHIIMDGWCSGLIISEFMEIYDSLLHNRSSRLAKAPQYGLFIKWLERQDKHAAADYWKNYLAGCGTCTGLPKTALQRTAIYDNKEVELVIPELTSSALLALSIRELTTLNTLMQAIWSVLLSKYNESNDVSFGTVISIRPPEIPAVENIVGIMINTLPVWVQLRPGISFTVLLKEIQAKALAAESHRFSPLAEIQAASQYPNGIFDHVFITENFPVEQKLQSIKAADGEPAFRAAFTGGFSQTNYDLNIILIPGNTIKVRFNYNANVYHHAFMQQVVNHFKYLIQQILQQPSAALEDLTLMTIDEERALLEKGRGMDSDYTGTLMDAFEKVSTRYAEQVALISEKGTLQYKVLRGQVDHLAVMLALQGIGKGDRVAVMLKRSEDMIVSILAILKIGAVYIALDSAHPLPRLEHIINTAVVKMVLTNADIAAIAPVGCRRFFVEKAMATPVPNNIVIDSCIANDTAYIIFTSGTSGYPKAVPIRHESVVSRVKYHIDYLDITATDCILQFAPVSFDASIVEIFMALLSGGKLYLLAEADKQNLELFASRVEAAQVTVAIFPPAYLKILQRYPLPKIRTIISTGEAAILDDMLWYAREKNVYNGYGPSEVCIGASFHKVNLLNAAQYKANGNVPIGKAFADTSIYIMNSRQQLLPPGVSGEICIAGIGLSRGYPDQPALTTEKFVHNPYGLTENESMLYRTGDLGRWNSSYELEYLGRMDDQVQIRGIRVETGEIEFIIRQYPGVTNAIVRTTNTDNILLAYITANETIEVHEVRAFIRQRLPEYMVPAAVIQVADFPLTSNGKIDIRELFATAYTKPADHDKPLTEVEQLLISEFSKVLGKRINAADNFFMLGGDSIKAIQLASRLYRNGYKLEVQDIFNYPVIADMALHITPLKHIVSQAVVTGVFPLTPIQREFFDLDLQYPHHYNQGVLLRSVMELDVSLVEQVITALQHQHDALRMTFNRNHDTWQQVNEDLSMPIEVYSIDLRTALSATNALHTALQQMQRSIQLDKGPLFKAAVIKMPDGDRLFLLIHHLVVDAISWRILFEDMATLYASGLAKQTMLLPQKTDSFKTWSEKLHEYANSDAFCKDQAYWFRMPVTTAGCIAASADVQHHARTDNNISFQLDEDTTIRLLQKSGIAYGTQINEILLAALARALKTVYGNNETWITLEGHGREDIIPGIDINRTVGWFTNIYPVLLDGRYSQDTGMQIKMTKELLRSIPNKGIGYGLMKYCRKDIADSPLAAFKTPQLLFNYLGQFDTAMSGPGFEFAPESTGDSMNPDETMTYEITITGSVLNNRLQMGIRYNPTIHSGVMMQSLCASLQHSLTEMIFHCSNKTVREYTPADFDFNQFPVEQLEQLQIWYLQNTGSVIHNLYILSPMQEGILYNTLAHYASGAYVNQVRYRVSGRVLPHIVEKSLDLLIARYEVLRTVFEYKHFDKLLQVVLSERVIKVMVEDLQHLTSSRLKDEYAAEYLQKDRKKTFDLSKDLLLRLSILQLDKEDFLFVWTSHHIILDGWCMGVLLREFQAIYQGFINDRLAVLNTPVQYNSYIRWLSKTDLHAGLTFWSSYLKGFETATPLLIADTGNSGDRDKKHLRYSIGFAEAQTVKITTLAAGCQMTTTSLLQTIWGILLSKYNNTRDVVFGVVVSGRPADIAGIENMVGLFINTIPVRVQYDSTATFTSLGKQIQDNAVAAEPYHYCSLSQIQSVSPLKQGLVSHVLDFNNYPVADALEPDKQPGGVVAADWKISAVNNHEETEYELFIVISYDKKIQVHFNYDEAVYSTADIEQLAVHFSHLVTQVLENKWVRIDDLQLCNPIEKKQLLSFAQGAPKSFPITAGYAAHFRIQARNVPGNRAVDDGATQWTYAELDEWSDQWCDYLCSNGVSKAVIVGVYMDRSVYLTGMILAIWKAGGVYMPLNPDLPLERIQFMLEDAQVKIVINNTPQRINMDAVKEHLFRDVLLDKQPLLKPALAGVENDWAYLLYTSGSTGLPKGVMVEHSGMLNHMFSRIDRFQMDVTSKVAQTASHSFDISIWQMMAVLLAGGNVRIYGSADMLNTHRLLEQIKHDKITVLQLVPTYLSELLIAIDENNKYLLNLSGIHSMITIGEALKKNVVQKWFSYFPDIPLFNAYGPTEAADTIADHLMNTVPAGKHISLGRPIHNMHIYVLDSLLNLCPIGVPGEICVSGPGVGRGYLYRPEKTAKVFISDPFNPSIRMYRTGDLGSWSRDGLLNFHGRKDFQVKINGHRIELGEIEQAMTAYEDVLQAVVIYYPEKNEQEWHGLAAYVVYKKESIVYTEDLRERLLKKLPVYMVPAVITELENFPVNTSGKIDHKMLPVPNKYDATATVEEPMFTAVEMMLAGIWKKVLGLSHVSKKDHYLRVGGDSIGAIQISSRCYAAGYRLDVKDIMLYPVFEEMLSHTEILTSVADQSAITGEVMLTPIQHRFFAAKNLNYNHYNQALMFDLPNRLNAEVITTILNRLLDHHDALRMRFVFKEDGHVEQVNEASRTLELSFHNWRNEKKYLEKMHLAADALQSSLSLVAGRVVAAGVFSLPETDKLLLVVHHLVIDAVSWRIIMEDFRSLLTQYEQGLSFSLPLKTDSFRTWAASLAKHARKKEFQNEYDYWEKLTARPAQQIVFTNEAFYTQSVSVIELLLDVTDTTRMLKNNRDRLDIQVNDMLITALGLAIREVFNKERIFIDIEGHGRENIFSDHNFSRTVGWFTTIYPLYLQFSQPVNELQIHVMKVKDAIRQVPYKGLGFGIFKYLCDAPAGKQPAAFNTAQVLFNYLGQFDGHVQEQGVAVSMNHTGALMPENSFKSYPLSVAGFILDEQLHLKIEYDNTCLSPAIMENFIKHYQELLIKIIWVCAEDIRFERADGAFGQQELSSKDLQILNSLLK